ncbi:hypothetical protein EI94DRAFT_1786430 [Lactarius quietus]|nr:hypothetical protein EI94DRAFT_1786430 [Lactarius quietus]
MQTKKANHLREPTRPARNDSHIQQLSTNQGQDQDQDPQKLASSSHSSRISNLQELPVELLVLIFTFCTMTGRLEYPALLPMTHVCRQWRTIALSYGQLWASIYPGLSLRWMKVFMERSRKTLMDLDFDFLVGSSSNDFPYHRNRLSHKDDIPLLKDFTRVRSLCLDGICCKIHPVMDSIRHSLPVQSLSLHIYYANHHTNRQPCSVHLPDDLFGGVAPIRRLKMGGSPTVAPHWLLDGVTHFTSTMSVTPSELLGVLRQMSALTYFDFTPEFGNASWKSGADDQRLKPIPMPQLKNVVVRTTSPDAFILLKQLLLLDAGAKRQLHLLRYMPIYMYVRGESFTMHRFDDLPPIIEAVDGFQHTHFSGSQERGWCRLWSGNAATWEDAELSLFFDWGKLSRQNLPDFIAAYDTLDVARVRRLVIDSPPPVLPTPYRWKLLENFSGVEELELYPSSVGTFGDAWKEKLAPAVLPALRRVRIVDYPSPQYTIIGDPPTRKIVRHSNSTANGDVVPFPEVSAERELGNLSKGLLTLLQGLGGER